MAYMIDPINPHSFKCLLCTSHQSPAGLICVACVAPPSNQSFLEPAHTSYVVVTVLISKIFQCRLIQTWCHAYLYVDGKTKVLQLGLLNKCVGFCWSEKFIKQLIQLDRTEADTSQVSNVPCPPRNVTNHSWRSGEFDQS